MVRLMYTGRLFVSETDRLSSPGSTFTLDASKLLSDDVADGFEKALGSRTLVFPEDHGPHPGFRNEWWYITGHLFDDAQNRYGYQLTFFRRRLSANGAQQGWQNNTITMAHFAVSDHKNGRFIAREKFGRDGANVAGAQSSPFRVWLDDWSIQSADPTDDTIFPLTLHAKNELLSLTLTLTAKKPLTLQGNNGFSKKGEHAGNASHYYSFTRLNATGTLLYQQQHRSVSGISWMDREWGTGVLSKHQQGWDWLALQLSNGDDVMFFQIRRDDGTLNPFSSGIVVKANNQTIALARQHVQLTPLQYWKNRYGQRFPIKWQMQIEHADYRNSWIIQTPLPHQFLDLSVRYWEGAVDVIDGDNQQPVGLGFLEMTGYPSD